MFKAAGIHSLCQFHPITFVKAQIDVLAVHCHMVPWGVYSIGPVAVKPKLCHFFYQKSNKFKTI